MRLERAILPFRGVTDASALRDTPPGFVPFDSLRNFVPFVPGEDRFRGGTRPGFTRFINERIAPGRVQAIVPIALSSVVEGYTIDEGTCGDIEEGESREGGTITGNAWMLNDVPAMMRDWADTRGTGTRPVPAVCWDPDGERAYFLLNFTNAGGEQVCGVTAVNRDGDELWQAELRDRDTGSDPVASPADVLNGNTVEADAHYIYVAVERYVYVLRKTDGFHLRRYNIGGWSRETVEARVRPDGRLAVAFNGSGTAATLPNGPEVVEGASDFRSGVALFDVRPSVPSDPLVRVQFGPVLPSNDPFFESNHGYFRMSEWMGGRPRGSRVEALCVLPDNGVVVARRNKGWGPNGDYPPSDDQPYITIFRLDASGSLVWQVDTDSIRDAYSGWWGTFYNDRGSAEASIQAVAADDLGNVYAGGAVSPRASACVFRLDAATGALVAKVNLQTTVRGSAMHVAPRSRLVGVAGDRGNSWPGAAGRNAMLWLLNPGTLAPVRHYDLNAAVSGLGVKFNADDEIVLGTDFVT